MRDKSERFSSGIQCSSGPDKSGIVFEDSSLEVFTTDSHVDSSAGLNDEDDTLDVLNLIGLEHTDDAVATLDDPFELAPSPL